MGSSTRLSAKVLCVAALTISAGLLLMVRSGACGSAAAWTEPLLLTEESDIYFDSDISIGKDNVYVVSWTYDDGPVYLFRSPDRGATWNVKDVLGQGVFRGEPGMCVYSDGTDDVVLLATAGNIYRSNDSGENFAPLASLSLSDGALWWRFMEVYTNGSWFGRAVDDFIYMVGSQAFGVPWEGGHYVVSFCRSQDGGLTWEEPVPICDMDRDTSLPELVCDGERLFVFYTMGYGDYMDLYVRHSDDWGQTWSSEQVLIERRGTGWVCPHSVQDVGAGRALLALGDYVSVEDLNLGEIPYGRYGYFHYSDSTFEEVGNVSGDEWAVAGGFSAALTWENELMLAWARSDGHPYNRIWFTVEDEPGLFHAYGKPWIVSSPGLKEGVGDQYQYAAQALEGDAGENRWSMQTDAQWLSASDESDTSCLISGTPAAAGSYWVNVTVSDDNSTDSINYTIMVAGAPDGTDDDDSADGGTRNPTILVAALAVVAAVAIIAALLLVMKRRGPPGQA